MKLALVMSWYICRSIIYVAYYLHKAPRLEPNMLKNLPIIPSRTSKNFHPLFFFIPIAPLIIPFVFYCVSDNITMQELLYIIYIADYVILTAVIQHLTVLLEYLNLFAN